MTKRLAKETVYKEGIDVGVDRIYENYEQKDKFIQEVLEILFGAEAVIGNEIKRNFSYREALEELRNMNNVYTEYLMGKRINDEDTTRII